MKCELLRTIAGTLLALGILVLPLADQALAIEVEVDRLARLEWSKDNPGDADKGVPFLLESWAIEVQEEDGGSTSVDDIRLLYRSPLSFDLSAYQGSTAQGDATLFLTIGSKGGAINPRDWFLLPSGRIGVYEIDETMADWSMFDVTWNNFSNAFVGDPVVLIPDVGYNPDTDEMNNAPGDEVSTVIPQALLQKWLDGTNAGVMLKLVEEVLVYDDLDDRYIRNGVEWAPPFTRVEGEQVLGPNPPRLVFEIGGLACDFDNSSTCDDADIDLLAAAVRDGTSDPQFNVDGIGGDVPDQMDFAFHITDAAHQATGFGDADLNKMVNFVDFVSLSNDFGMTGTGWAKGNFNTDDVTNFVDFVALSNNFNENFASGSNVPEPMGAVLLGLGGLALVWRKR